MINNTFSKGEVNTVSQEDFERALNIGRPPNIKKKFPNSRSLIVSGKVIDRALLLKKEAMTIAANGRNNLIIRGALKAAQRANAAIIVEIAKSEGGINAYCSTSYWNIASQVDQIMNELGITIPVAIHADHYTIKSSEDVEIAKVEIPSMFEHGITSIAIDASHMINSENLLATIELSKYIPTWAGLETEVGEIKGKEGLSTEEEALFLIQGLNAYGVFPDWIALNNGTAHGIQTSEEGIQVELTIGIHNVLRKYKISGAQHGTSGNDSERLKRIAKETFTTKANVATALQMLNWGVDVDVYGNAVLDENGNFLKRKGCGVSSNLWTEMVTCAEKKGLYGGNYKKLNLLFENKILSQAKVFRERSEEAVTDFVYDLLVNVFNAENSASLAIVEILEKGSYDLGSKVDLIEDVSNWKKDDIKVRGSLLDVSEESSGDFDD